MKYVKKITSMAIIFILIALFILLIHFISKRENNFLKPIKMQIISPLKDQIQSIDDVRLDRIIVDVIYQNGHQNHVLTKDMVSEEDVPLLEQVGKQNITICYEDLTMDIPMVIYDEALLRDNYIFYIEENYNDIIIEKDIYHVEKPYKEDQYFYGWKINTDMTIDNSKIVSLSPKWSNDPVYKIDFYVSDFFVKRQYVVEDEEIIYPAVSVDDFAAWDYEEKTTRKDRDISAVILNDNQVIIRFYTKYGECIDYQILEKGQDCVEQPIAPPIEGEIFYAWSSDLKDVAESQNCYPIYYKENEEVVVRFYDTEMKLLQTKVILAGETASYDYPENDYDYVVGYSKKIDHVFENTDVIVYFGHYLYYYYAGEDLYAVTYSYNANSNIPYGYTMSDGTYVDSNNSWYWKKREGTRNVFDLTKKEDDQL